MTGEPCVFYDYEKQEIAHIVKLIYNNEYLLSSSKWFPDVIVPSVGECFRKCVA